MLIVRVHISGRDYAPHHFLFLDPSLELFARRYLYPHAAPAH